MKFKAFLSHSHSQKSLARWLFKKLDGYRPPKEIVNQSASPWRIFLDEAELAATEDLPRKIIDALEASEVLVVISSDQSLVSSYVEMEVERFCASGHGRVLLLVAEEREHDDVSHYIPRELSKRGIEPLAIDLRTNDRTQAFHKVVAGILEVEYGDLVDREQRRKLRRTVLWSTVSAATVSIVALLSSAAILQIGNAAQAISLSKATEGLRSLERGELSVARRLFNESLFISDNSIARDGLIGTLVNPLSRSGVWLSSPNLDINSEYAGNLDDQLTSVEFITPSDVVVGDKSGRIRRVDILNGETIWEAFVGTENSTNAHRSPIADLEYDEETELIVSGDESGQVSWIDPINGNVQKKMEVNAKILSLRLHPHAPLLAIGTTGGVQVIDDEDNTVLDMMHGHAGRVQGLAFNQASALLFWGGSTSRIWGCEIGVVPCQQYSYVDQFVYSIDQDQSGRFVVYSEGEQVSVVDMYLEKLDESFRGSSHIYALGFIPDSNVFVSASSDNFVRMHDARTRKLLTSERIDTKEIYDLSVNPTGKILATVGLGGTVDVWNVHLWQSSLPIPSRGTTRSNMQLARPQANAIQGIRALSASELHVTGSQMDQYSFPSDLNVDHGGADAVVPELETAQFIAQSLYRSRTLAWNIRDFDEASTWAFLNPELESELSEIVEGFGGVQAQGITADGEYYAVVSNAGELYYFDSTIGVARRIPGSFLDVSSVDLVPQHSQVLIGTKDGNVATLNTSTNEVMHSFQCGTGIVMSSFSIAINGDRTTLTVNADGSVCLHNSDGEVLIKRRSSSINALALSNDEKTLAVAGADGLIQVFSTNTLQRIFSLEGHADSINAIHYSLEDDLLYSGGNDETLRYWPIRKMIEVKTGNTLASVDEVDKSTLLQELPQFWSFLRWVGAM